jgi:hypothetical protein
VGEGAGVVTLDEDVLLEVEELDFELDELLELEDVVGFVLDEDELLEVVTDVDAFELVDVFEDVTNEPGVEVLLLDVDALLEEEEMDLGEDTTELLLLDNPQDPEPGLHPVPQ